MTCCNTPNIRQCHFLFFFFFFNPPAFSLFLFSSTQVKMSSAVNDAGFLIHGLFMSVVIRPLMVPILNGIPPSAGFPSLGPRRRGTATTFSSSVNRMRSYVGGCVCTRSRTLTSQGCITSVCWSPWIEPGNCSIDSQQSCTTTHRSERDISLTVQARRGEMRCSLLVISVLLSFSLELTLPLELRDFDFLNAAQQEVGFTLLNC